MEKSDEGEEHPLNGLCYKVLPDSVRATFGRFNIDVKTVSKQSPKDLVYDIYQDIGSGSDNLSAQQVRRAAYKGLYLKLIDELRMNTNLKSIRSSQSKREKKDNIEGAFMFIAIVIVIIPTCIICLSTTINTYKLSIQMISMAVVLLLFNLISNWSSWCYHYY